MPQVVSTLPYKAIELPTKPTEASHDARAAPGSSAGWERKWGTSDMCLAGFCELAARENIRLHWRARANQDGSVYRIELTADVADHISQHWREPYPASQPLWLSLERLADRLEPFYRDLIGRRRTGPPSNLA